jgi:putative ABC transport system substrate-binding protein
MSAPGKLVRSSRWLPLRRRTFISGVALGFVAVPRAVDAQQAAKVPRIGWLATASLESPEGRRLVNAFRQGLRERGYVEGENIVIEYRSAEGKSERLPGLNVPDSLLARADQIIE